MSNFTFVWLRKEYNLGMTFSVLFNWPFGENSARFSLGMPNASDSGSQFRVGIIEKNEPDKIKWLKPGWVNHDEITKVDGYIKRGDHLVIEQRNKGTQAVTGRIRFNSDARWPAEANGRTSISQNFTTP